MAELANDQRVLGGADVPGLAGVCVLSGYIDGKEPGEILKGGATLRATLVRSNALGRMWRWLKIDSGSCSAPIGADWPTWDGIHDGDEITIGHLKQLHRDGFLSGEAL